MHAIKEKESTGFFETGGGRPAVPALKRARTVDDPFASIPVADTCEALDAVLLEERDFDQEEALIVETIYVRQRKNLLCLNNSIQ